MNGSNSTLYYRYGAYELKARYQANLLMAQMLVLILIGLGLAVWSVIPKGQTVVISPLQPRHESRVEIPPPPRIIPPTPQPGGHTKPPVDHAIIPVPVDDSPETDPIPTREERAIGSGLDSSIGIGDSSLSVDPGQTELLLDPTVFVPCDSLPVMIREVKPDYPPQAIRAGLEGRVTLQVLVDKEGGVRKVVVLVSSGLECLDIAAVNSARLCRYRPAIQNGHPIAVWVTYPVVFRLN
ncbi:MAG: energy transducer TonB [candidate division Zixibacteria bacterium]|nr:energy transducer TonB [candidate division Zixibacteria bacterium]